MILGVARIVSVNSGICLKFLCQDQKPSAALVVYPFSRLFSSILHANTVLSASWAMDGFYTQVIKELACASPDLLSDLECHSIKPLYPIRISFPYRGIS